MTLGNAELWPPPPDEKVFSVLHVMLTILEKIARDRPQLEPHWCFVIGEGARAILDEELANAPPNIKAFLGALRLGTQFFPIVVRASVPTVAVYFISLEDPAGLEDEIARLNSETRDKVPGLS